MYRCNRGAKTTFSIVILMYIFCVSHQFSNKTNKNLTYAILWLARSFSLSLPAYHTPGLRMFKRCMSAFLLVFTDVPFVFHLNECLRLWLRDISFNSSQDYIKFERDSLNFEMIIKYIKIDNRHESASN